MCFKPSRPCNGDSGCTAKAFNFGFNSRRSRTTPTNVPDVPSPVTKCVTRPSVWSPIPGAVPVVSWVRGPGCVVVVLIGIEIFGRIAREDLARDELRAVCQKHRVSFNYFNSVTAQNSFARAARILRQTDLNAVTA